jgi:hypothetical protein
MTYVDDLFEGNDRKPGDPEQEPPIDLDEVEALLRVYLSKEDGVGMSAAVRLADIAGDMAAELREARQRIADWEALPTREEWTVTSSRSRPPRSTDLRFTADAAMSLARDGKQAWRQVVVDHAVVHPWEPIDAEAPF